MHLSPTMFQYDKMAFSEPNSTANTARFIVPPLYRRLTNLYLCYVCRYSFIHSVICLTTGPKPPPKRCLHIMRSRASSCKWEYPLLSLRSSSSFLCLLPRLLATSISPFIFPSTTRFRRQFLHKIWPIQLAFRFLISCRKFLCSLTLSNTKQIRINIHKRNNTDTPSNANYKALAELV